MTRALIVVDVQKDFCEGGALPVEGGNLVADMIADYIKESIHDYKKIVFTLDWHNPPPDTNGGHFGDPPDYIDTWPVHCVAGTEGASFNAAFAKIAWIINARPNAIFKKGQGQPHYSGFQGVNLIGQSLGGYLNNMGITDVDVCGLATDYCVKETALDAIELGFKTNFLATLSAGITPNAARHTELAVRMHQE